MRGFRSILRKSDACQVGQYWDEVVRRAPATPMPHTDAAADAGETIRQIHGLEDRNPRRAPYADRQLRMLLARHQEMNTMNAKSAALPINGPFDRFPELRRSQTGLPAWDPGRRWVPALSGAAALAIVISLSVALAFFVNRPGGHPAILAPATQTTQASLTSAATAKLVWTYAGSGKEALSHPTAVTIGPDGNVWVVDGMNNRIVILSPDGKFMNAWGAEGSNDGQLMFCYSTSDCGGEVAFGPDGSIYAAESANERVQRFDKNFHSLMTWSGASTPNTAFGYLTGVSVDHDGNVWTSDTLDASVSKYSPEGKYLLTLGGVGTFSWTGSVGFDPDGNLLVADGRGTVNVYSLDGTLLRTMVLKHADGQPVVNVSDISTDAHGNIYVVENAGASGPNHPYPVLVYDPDGNLLLTWAGDDAHQLKNPWIVAADNDGNMYIADHDSSEIQKVHIDFSEAALSLH